MKKLVFILAFIPMLLQAQQIVSIKNDLGLYDNKWKPVDKAKEFLKGYKEQLIIRERVPVLIGSFIAGAGYGLNQTISHHYVYFEEIFPNANDQWWDPRISWVNKYELDVNGKPIPNGKGGYKERYWLSTTLLVAPTDAYHLTNFISRQGRGIKFTFYIQDDKKKWGYRILDGVIEFVAESIAFHATYSAPKIIHQWKN